MVYVAKAGKFIVTMEDIIFEKKWDPMFPIYVTAGVEAENLTKHENPMCTDYVIALRNHYKHSKYGFQAIMHQYQKPDKKKKALRLTNSESARNVDDLILKKVCLPLPL